MTYCHGSAWVDVITQTITCPRGSPLIGAARQRFPRGQLVWAASWLIELGRRFQSEQTCFVMFIGILWCLQIEMIEVRTCVKINM